MCVRTRSSAATVSVLLWLFTATLSVANVSMSSLVVRPRFFASS